MVETMHSKKLAQGRVDQKTQQYLDIYEIKDDVVILKDGSIRAVLLVSSINFALKGEEEQNAVIQAYVQFLNSIDFPIQVVIQSRKLDIDEYLLRLKNMEHEQSNELLRLQTADYRTYIKQLVEMADIMSKRFYLVVPYSPLSSKQKTKNFLARLSEALSPGSVITLQKKKFDQYKVDLERRVGIVSDGLASMGLKSVVLDTQSLIELYYNTYNPATAEQQKLANLNEIQVEE